MDRLLDQVVNPSLCDSFQGNAIVMPMYLIIRPGDKVGDVIHSAGLPGGLVYTGIEIRTEGNTPGLTLDVGYRGHGEDRLIPEQLTQFASGVDVAATGRNQLMNVSFPMSNFHERQIDHELTFTLGGTVTVDETVEVLVSAFYSGIL